MIPDDAYAVLLRELNDSGKPWDDRSYCYMNLHANDAATWLRAIPRNDFTDCAGLSDNCLQDWGVKLLEARGERRKELQEQFADWFLHKLIVAAADGVSADVRRSPLPEVARHKTTGDLADEVWGDDYAAASMFLRPQA